MPKDTFYFSHDYNARTDPKVKRLLARHGIIGYGIFWAIVEDLYNNANALPLDYESIAYDMRVDKSILESVVNDFDLFVLDGNSFSSNSIRKRLGQRDQKSETARQSALKRWERNANASEKNANALQPLSDSNAIKERKGKEKKVEESAINNPFFEMFRRVTGKHISDQELLEEISRFQNKYPNIHPNQAGALINAWASNIGLKPDKAPAGKEMVF